MSFPTPVPDARELIERIDEALLAAAEAIRPFTPGAVEWETKAERGDPVTAADLAADAVLRETLPRGREGWLSEETVDDRSRLDAEELWIVDPLDGTREFVEGIPEWCISVGFVRRGIPVAGGLLNPATGERILGAYGAGAELSRVGTPGERSPAPPRSGSGPQEPPRRADAPPPPAAGGSAAPLRDDPRDPLRGARVLASRSEVGRGEWERYRDSAFTVVPCGSVAWKLGLVAAGRADATWTLVPKHEWDVAGGAALVRAAGLHLCLADGSERTFNQPEPKLPNFLAGPRPLLERLRQGWLEG